MIQHKFTNVIKNRQTHQNQKCGFSMFDDNFCALFGCQYLNYFLCQGFRDQNCFYNIC